MNHENENENTGHGHDATVDTTNQETTVASDQNEASESPATEMAPPMPASVILENEAGESQPSLPEHDILPSSFGEDQSEDDTQDKTALPSRQ